MSRVIILAKISVKLAQLHYTLDLFMPRTATLLPWFKDQIIVVSHYTQTGSLKSKCQCHFMMSCCKGVIKMSDSTHMETRISILKPVLTVEMDVLLLPHFWFSWCSIYMAWTSNVGAAANHQDRAGWGPLVAGMDSHHWLLTAPRSSLLL